MSGINPDFQKELSRRKSSMNTLNEFLRYAKIEQDLYDTFEKSHRLPMESTKSNFQINHQQISSLTNMIEQPKQQYQFMNKINPRNDWINSNHVHLFGDQKKLTIPDKYGQLISIPNVEPIDINYPALLVNKITVPSYSQALVDIACKVSDANDFIFEPYERHI
ncbi:unnamed protein product [Rotaria sp. Silwood2]|nr:unnamed protein product [Rotaria sp. Silwood2]CAF2909782.1 unnamed protein product [Rotaria sp. Silwood2]CAF3145858.1 unnamed protein product [Rotaria sp. Silwood2]CAF3284981.1 unnamed protein product [Rotaria sp. Silwood2]